MRPNNGQEIFSRRIKNLRSRLDELGQTDLIILKHEDIYYLTGFYGKDSNSILVINTERVYLLVNFIYYEDAASSVNEKEVETIVRTQVRLKLGKSVLFVDEKSKTILAVRAK